jgi:hypothetical protein
MLLAVAVAFLSVFEKPQRDALAVLLLRLHHHGVIANAILGSMAPSFWHPPCSGRASSRDSMEWLLIKGAKV